MGVEFGTTSDKAVRFHVIQKCREVNDLQYVSTVKSPLCAHVVVSIHVFSCGGATLKSFRNGIIVPLLISECTCCVSYHHSCTYSCAEQENQQASMALLRKPSGLIRMMRKAISVNPQPFSPHK